MRKTLAALALLLGLAPAAAQQPNFTFLPPNTVVGRLGIGSGPAQAIPFATLGPLLGNAVSGPGTSTVGHFATWANTVGTQLADTPPPGSSGQVIFNNAGTLAGMSGTSWDNTNLALTVTGASVTTSNPILNLSQTWNASGVTFTGIKFNAINTASAAASLLMDLQFAGSSVLNLNKSGPLTLTSTVSTNNDFLIKNTAFPSQLRLQGVTDTFQFSNLILTDNTGGFSGSGHEWDFSHRNSHSFLFQNYNGVGFTNVLRLDENGTTSTFSSGVIGFGNSGSESWTVDTALSRVAAGVAGFGTGAAANVGGYMQWGGQARVTADVTFTSNVTLGTITGLSVNVAAGRTYSFQADISWTDAAAGGLQLAIAGTATATNIIYDGWIIDSAANGIKGNAQSVGLGGVVASSTTTGTAGHATIKGTITVNAAGTLLVQGAQNTSSGTATTFKRGSTFVVFDMP